MDPKYEKIPQHIRDTLLRYLQFGCPPGSFMTAVLSNDLRGALSNADAASLDGLKSIWLFTVNEMPGLAVGGSDDVSRWISDEALRKTTMNSQIGEKAIKILAGTHQGQAVTQGFRGETLDALIRELGVTTGKLAQWRDERIAAI